MKLETFKKGMILLGEAFPRIDLNPKFLWEMLQDLADEAYEYAIVQVIKFTKELYPGTNLTAIVRDYANAFLAESMKRTDRMIEFENTQKRLDRWREEAIPMPENCRKELKDRGIL